MVSKILVSSFFFSFLYPSTSQFYAVCMSTSQLVEEGFGVPHLSDDFRRNPYALEVVGTVMSQGGGQTAHCPPQWWCSQGGCILTLLGDGCGSGFVLAGCGLQCCLKRNKAFHPWQELGLRPYVDYWRGWRSLSSPSPWLVSCVCNGGFETRFSPKSKHFIKICMEIWSVKVCMG